MTHIPVWALRGKDLAYQDIPDRPGGRMPDFAVIGAAKCGTTSLNSYLAQHPALFMCPLKESNYFSTEALLQRGDQWYRGLYADATEGQLCGEASTSYTRFPAAQDVPRRLAEANPEMKLIYILREPVRRLESDVLQSIKYLRSVIGVDHTGMPLDDAFRMLDDPASPHFIANRAASAYITQIERYDDHFPRDRILVLFQEDLLADPQGFVDRIFAYLGVASETLDFGKARNQSSKYVGAARGELAIRRYRDMPAYHLARLALPKGAKDRIKALLGRGTGPEAFRFSDALISELHDYYRPFNDRLRDRLGLALDGWA